MRSRLTVFQFRTLRDPRQTVLFFYFLKPSFGCFIYLDVVFMALSAVCFKNAPPPPQLLGMRGDGCETYSCLGAKNEEQLSVSFSILFYLLQPLPSSPLRAAVAPVPSVAVSASTLPSVSSVVMSRTVRFPVPVAVSAAAVCAGGRCAAGVSVAGARGAIVTAAATATVT